MNEFKFKTDAGGSEGEALTNHIKNTLLPLMLIAMVAIVVLFLNGPVG